MTPNPKKWAKFHLTLIHSTQHLYKPRYQPSTHFDNSYPRHYSMSIQSSQQSLIPLESYPLSSHWFFEPRDIKRIKELLIYQPDPHPFYPFPGGRNPQPVSPTRLETLYS